MVESFPIAEWLGIPMQFEYQPAVSCSPVGYRLGGVKMGLGLRGKLGRARVYWFMGIVMCMVKRRKYAIICFCMLATY